MSDSTQYQSLITSNLEATIASSGSLSDVIDVRGTTLTGYIMPSAWTAADVTFQGSVDGTNFFNLHDQFGNEIKHVVDASRFIALNPSDLASVRFFKIRSGTSAAAVNQAAERKITIVTRSI